MKYGFTYKDKHSDDFNLLLHKAKRNIGAPTADEEMTIPGKDGIIYVMQNRKAKEIEIEFSIDAESPEALRELAYEVADWLVAERDRNNKPIPYALVFDDDTDRQWVGYTKNQISADDIVNSSEIKCTFIIPSAYVEDISKTNSGEGAGQVDVVNNGTLPVDAIITCEIQEVSDYLEIELFETGQFVRIENSDNFDYTLQAGDIVEVDTKKHYVSVNNIDARAGVTLDSEYFKLPKGESTLIAENSVVSAEWRERWK